MFTFLNSAFLMALPLAALPIILHMFHRRKRVRIAWGAMQFLTEAATKRRRLWRVADLLLMLLRLAAILAIILALTQPMMKSRALGQEGPRDIVLVLDTSLSMAQMNGQQSSFERAIKAADDVIEHLNASDSVRVIANGAVAESLTSSWVKGGSAKKELQAQLHKLTPTLGSSDVLTAVTSALDIDPADRQATRYIVLLGDNQALSWHPERGEEWKSLREKIKNLPFPVTVNAINVAEGAGNPVNISIEAVTANRTLAGVGQSLILAAQLRNTGHTRTPATMVQWRDGDKEFGTTPVQAIEPGQTTSVNVEHPFAEAGVHAINCEAKFADDLPPDSAGQLIVEIKDQLPILVVDGTPQIKGPESGTDCLLAALGRGRSGPAGTWHSVLQPTVIDPLALGEETLIKYGAIALINAAPPKAETIRKLAEYVRNGGGLWIVLGSNVQPAAFNELFFDHAQGLSPLALGTPVGDAASHEKAETIHPAEAQHAATRLIADAQKLDLDRVRIYRRHQFDASNMNRKVGTLLSTSQGAPLAVERGFGSGRIIVQAIPFGTDWSNLPLNQAFVVWANECLWYLAEPSVTNWNLNPGETLEASFPSESWRESAKATNPLGRAFAITGRVRGTQTDYRFSRTLWPGDWKLEMQNKENKTLTLPFHVQRDTKESDLTQVTAEETKTIAEAAGLQFAADPLAETKGNKAPPRPEPVWPFLLAGLLALLILEPLIASFITRNRNYQTPSVRVPMSASGENTLS